MPDRDFYYLVGCVSNRRATTSSVRSGPTCPTTNATSGESVFERSKQLKVRKSCTMALYESRFLRKMKERHQQANDDSEFIDSLIQTSVNLVSCVLERSIFRRLEQPQRDRLLFLGFVDLAAGFGAAAVLLRKAWEVGGGDEETKRQLITYNIEDCRAVEVVAGLWLAFAKAALMMIQRDWNE